MVHSRRTDRRPTIGRFLWQCVVLSFIAVCPAARVGVCSDAGVKANSIQPRLCAANSNNTINVQQYRVAGNGGDDSATLQKALRACAGQAGAVVEARHLARLRTNSRVTVPANCTLLLGPYTWTVGVQDGISFSSGDCIVGQGQGKTFIRYADGVSTGKGVGMLFSADRRRGSAGVVIRGLTIDGNRQRTISMVSISSGSNRLIVEPFANAATPLASYANFRPSDVGKRIQVPSALSNGRTLETTISAVINANHVTLSAPAAADTTGVTATIASGNFGSDAGISCAHCTDLTIDQIDVWNTAGPGIELDGANYDVRITNFTVANDGAQKANVGEIYGNYSDGPSSILLSKGACNASAMGNGCIKLGLGGHAIVAPSYASDLYLIPGDSGSLRAPTAGIEMFSTVAPGNMVKNTNWHDITVVGPNTTNKAIFCYSYGVNPQGSFRAVFTRLRAAYCGAFGFEDTGSEAVVSQLTCDHCGLSTINGVNAARTTADTAAGSTCVTSVGDTSRFVVNQKIKILGAGASGGPLISTLTAIGECSGPNSFTIAPGASMAVTKGTIYTSMWGVHWSNIRFEHGVRNQDIQLGAGKTGSVDGAVVEDVVSNHPARQFFMANCNVNTCSHNTVRNVVILGRGGSEGSPAISDDAGYENVYANNSVYNWPAVYPGVIAIAPGARYAKLIGNRCVSSSGKCEFDPSKNPTRSHYTFIP